MSRRKRLGSKNTLQKKKKKKNWLQRAILVQSWCAFRHFWVPVWWRTDRLRDRPIDREDRLVQEPTRTDRQTNGQPPVGNENSNKEKNKNRWNQQSTGVVVSHEQPASASISKVWLFSQLWNSRRCCYCCCTKWSKRKFQKRKTEYTVWTKYFVLLEGKQVKMKGRFKGALRNFLVDSSGTAPGSCKRERSYGVYYNTIIIIIITTIYN